MGFHSILSLWEAMIRGTTPDWQHRFQHDMSIFRDFRKNIEDFRKDPARLALEPFISNRRNTSGVDLVLDLIEYAEGLHIPNHVIEDPVLVQLKRDTSEIMVWANVGTRGSSLILL